MSDVFLEALQNYLQGREWKQNIEVFVESNCKLFYRVKEFNHEHHALWKSFQEIVENILDFALQNVGGSMASLESAIDTLARKPARGPRDAIVQDVLKRLTSVQNFEDFSEMMASAADDRLSAFEYNKDEHRGSIGNTNDADGYDNQLRDEDDEISRQLQGFGFSEELVDMVLENAAANATLEDLVMTLSELQAQPKGSSSYSSTSKQSTTGSRDCDTSRGSKHYDGKESSYEAPKTPTNTRQDGRDLTYLSDFAQCVNVLDVGELFAKFSTAKSVFDILYDDQSFSETEALHKWAADMLELHEDIVQAYENSALCSETCNRRGQSLPAWFATLEAKRREIDEASSISGGGNMLSDAEMRRLAELDRIAAMGTEDEQQLHHLLSRHDDIQREVNALHKQLAIMVASDANIQRSNLEELYYHLKEQVGSGSDLELVADEMHDMIYSNFSSSNGAQLVSILLDMHILEDEQMMLKRRINSLMGSPDPFTASAVNNSDSKHAQDFFDEKSSRDHDAYKGECGANRFSPSTGSAAGPQHRQSTAKFLNLLDEAEAKNSDDYNNRIFESPSGRKNTSPDALSRHQSSSSTSKMNAVIDNRGPRDEMDNERCSSPRRLGNSQPQPADRGRIHDADGSSSNAVYLEDMKTNHKAALLNLKNTLEAEKNKRLKDLEEKLLRRRLRKNVESTNSTEAEMKGIIEAGVREVEQEILETKQHFEELQGGLVSGFKKRCVYEVKAAKSIGRPLSKTEFDVCHRDAADALKKRFERDQKQLLDSLEAERMRQRTRMLKTLEKRKKSARSDAEVENMVANCRNEIELMNQSFDAQESEAIAKPHGDVMLALSSIFMDDGILVDAKGADNGRHAINAGEEEDEEEEAAYLEDGVRSHKVDDQKRLAWLDNIQKMRTIYMSAGQQIHQKMRRAHRHALGSNGNNSDLMDELDCIADDDEHDKDKDNNDGDGVVDGPITGVTAHLLNVITEAYSNQIVDIAADPNFKVDKSLVDNKVKAHILEEFEKARGSYDDALNKAKLYSQEQLFKRRTNKKNKANASINAAGVIRNDGDDDVELIRVSKGQMLLEDIVDSFLDDPIEILKHRPSEGVNNNSNAASIGGSLSSLKLNVQLPYKKNVRLAPLHMPDPNSPAKLGLLGSPDMKPSRRVLRKEAEAEAIDEKDRIKQDFIEKEKDLVDGLYSQMVLRKHMLEDRLRKKRDAKEKAAAKEEGKSSANLVNMDVEDEDEATPQDIKNLEQAFESVVELIKNTRSSDLDKVEISSLMTVMEKIVKGEKISTLPTPVGTDLASDTMTSTSDQFATAAAQRESDYRAQMQEEVKRISSVYNEERQKLDLVLKMQQARQRQNLQRKLLERKRGSLI